MVGRQGISDRNKAQKSSNLVHAKDESPKEVGTTSNASSALANGTKKKSRKDDDSDADNVILQSSSPEPESDDSIEYVSNENVGIDDESKKGKRNGGKSRAIGKEVNKPNGIRIREAEATTEKKKMNGASRRQSEGKKEHEKKLKKVEEEEALSEEEVEEKKKIGAVERRSENKKPDQKPKGKYVAKSPEKSKKGSDASKPHTEGNGEKESYGKRLNEVEKEDRRDGKRQKTNVVEVEKETNDTKQMPNDGAKKEKNHEKKQENKKQKKKVKEVEEQRRGAGEQWKQGKKQEKEYKKKNKEVQMELEDEEEHEQSHHALYKFPMNRVSRIIKSEILRNKHAQEAVFVINKASVCTL